jgi:hypothetical protein
MPTDIEALIVFLHLDFVFFISPLFPRPSVGSQTELLLQLLYANLTTWEVSNNTRVEFWPFQGVIQIFGNCAPCSLFSQI